MSRRGFTQMLSLMLSACCLSYVTGSRIWAQDQEEIRISVIDYPRPLVPAVRQIEEHFGRIVTYEDIRYLHASDIVDATEKVSRSADKSKRIFQMRGGNIALSYTPRPGTVDAQVEDVLQEVLAHSKAMGNAGGFRVERVSGGFHVVPTTTLAKSGAIAPYISPLEARITLPPRSEDGLEMMVRLAEAVSTGSGVTVNPGVMPMTRMARARVVVGANNEPARDVLWRALQSIGPDLSYELLCGVGETGTCGLSIHPVRLKR